MIAREPPRAAARAALGLAEGDTVVALLPRSRRSEIQYIAPRVLAAAAPLHAGRPGLHFVLPVVPGCAGWSNRSGAATPARRR